MPVLGLTDLERRVLGNLSIPRNVTDLAGELRRDEHSPFGLRPDDVIATDHELAELLEDLEGAGLVVKLGDTPDLAQLSARIADGTKKSLPTGDEKARNYLERLSVPQRAWRAHGELFMLTEDGLELIKQPLGATGYASREQVETALREHARQVLDPSDKQRRDGKLALARGVFSENLGRSVATLLPEEYQAWAKAVTEDFHRAHPDQPKLTAPVMGGMPGYGNATEDLIQAADAGGTAYGETSPTYMALSLIAFTDADTGTTADDASHVPTYTGWARKSVATADLGTSSAGSRSNANAIIWAGATAGSSTVQGFARCTTLTGGRIIRYGTCASTTISATQTPAQFAAGALTDTLD